MGVVVSQRSRHVFVAIESGIERCSLRKALFQEASQYTHPVAVGDRVRITVFSKGDAVVEEVLPRRSVLCREDVGSGKLKIIVANVDQVAACVSIKEPDFRPRILDRILVAAESEKLSAFCLLNKIDLVEDLAPYQGEIDLYEGLGYEVLLVSASDGRGMDGLRARLKGRTTVFCGHSGVGKSSLVNAVQPGLQLQTGEISEKGSKGRHTTTSSSLLPLDFSGFVVDTPGIRGFGVHAMEPWEIALCFPEMAALAPECHFAPCTHDHEPDCAVKDALMDGGIDPRRYLSYQRIMTGEDPLRFFDPDDDDDPEEDSSQNGSE